MDTIGDHRGTRFECSDGGHLQFQTAGVGEPVVLIHGFGLDFAMWDPQWAALSQGYRVVRYDLRGYGRSSRPTGRYSHVEDYLALARFLEASPAHLIGLSMGGRLALRIAAEAPSCVRSLTLADSALDGHAWSEEWLTRWRAMGAAATQDVQDAKHLWLQHDLFAPARGKPPVAAALESMVQRYSGWHFEADDPGVGPARPVTEVLSTIESPTLVIVGALDLSDFQAIAQRLAADMPRASLKIIPGAGHMSNMEAPRLFNELVLAHLSSVRA